MSDGAATVFAILALFAMAAFFLWLIVFVPLRMARNRGRDPGVWILLSVIASALIAIPVLWYVGPATPSGHEP